MRCLAHHSSRQRPQVDQTGLRVTRVLADADLLDHAGLLRHHRLLAHLGRLDGLAREQGLVGRRHWPVDRAPVDVHGLVAQGDLLLDRLLNDVGADPHAAALGHALANVEPLLHDWDVVRLTRSRTGALERRGARSSCRRAGCGRATRRRVPAPAFLAPGGLALVKVDRAVLLVRAVWAPCTSLIADCGMPADTSLAWAAWASAGLSNSAVIVCVMMLSPGLNWDRSARWRGRPGSRVPPRRDGCAAPPSKRGASRRRGSLRARG